MQCVVLHTMCCGVYNVLGYIQCVVVWCIQCVVLYTMWFGVYNVLCYIHSALYIQYLVSETNMTYNKGLNITNQLIRGRTSQHSLYFIAILKTQQHWVRPWIHAAAWNTTLKTCNSIEYDLENTQQHGIRPWTHVTTWNTTFNTRNSMEYDLENM